MNKKNTYNLTQITSEDQASLVAEQAYVQIMDQGFKKAKAVQFLDQLKETLQSKDITAFSKTMTLHVIKEINYHFDSKLMSVIASHKIYDFLVHQANSIDPKKRLQQKGTKKFPENPDLGIQYMRVLLECLHFWSQKYAKGSNDQPSKFKKSISDLKSKGIDLPKNYIYLDVARARSKRKGATQKPSPTEAPPTPSYKEPEQTPVPNNVQKNHLAGDLAFTKDKICLYMGTLQDETDDQILIQQIRKNHRNFNEQLKKYENKKELLQKPGYEQLIANFFQIHNFLEQQTKLYTAHVSNDDYPSYLNQLKIVYEKSALDSKEKPKVFIDQINAKQRDTPPQHSIYDHKRQQPSTLPDKMMPKQKNLMENLFTRLQQRSKSPHQGGFKKVNKQLEEEKSAIRKNPLRRTSRSPITNRSVSLSRSATAIGSKISPIFNNPPNRYPAPKNYDGDTVHENRDLTKIIFSIKKEQGIRRFKISNFRQKNPLYENQHIQVGYKSSALYETISGFSQFICLNVFIGNRTDKVIKNVRVQYKADSNQLLYANPKNVDSLIPAGYQNKHDLMIAPIKIPFGFMVMNLSYSIDNSNMAASVVLPNSILKFASYMSINKREYESNWEQAQKYKTLPFQLCKYFSPDSLKKWISALQYGSDYKRFSQEGSQTDLQLFCEVILLQKHEGILKINIRPNLKVVLQVGVLDNDLMAHEQFKSYLQTLELIMKQIDV